MGSEESALRRRTSAIKSVAKPKIDVRAGWNIKPDSKKANSSNAKSSSGDISKQLSSTPNVNTKPSPSTDGVKLDTIPGATQPIDYKFNLPPHQWSLPTRPHNVSNVSATYNINEFLGMTDNEKKIATASANSYLLKDDPKERLSKSQKNIKAFHGFRRARIWTFKNTDYSLGETQTQTKTEDDGIVKLFGKPINGAYAEKFYKQRAADLAAAEKYKKEDQERQAKLNQETDFARDIKWGFQFLWNPETISNSVSLNQSVTPSSSDIFKASAGIFLSQENISLTINVDRTNDFACFRGLSETLDFNTEEYRKYYLNRYPFEDKFQNFNDQLTKLIQLGTMADIEYLYKTINGSGVGKTMWTNILGKPTADIGFLTPRIIAVQFGPDINSISYAGQAMSLSVTHTAFTETMIPIRSVVNLNIMVFSGYGNTN
jgi:hypothetical protein